MDPVNAGSYVLTYCLINPRKIKIFELLESGNSSLGVCMDNGNSHNHLRRFKNGGFTRPSCFRIKASFRWVWGELSFIGRLFHIGLLWSFLCIQVMTATVRSEVLG